MSLRIYNTLSREVELLEVKDKKIRMFVCGPTVYNYIHIGNARTFVFFDVLAKYLRFSGYDLRYIQNITNIDDKIINLALEGGRKPEDVANEFEKKFMDDMRAIKITSVDQYARASDYVDEVIKQVKTLVEKGHAYEIKNDGWYFDLTTFHQYGILSGRTAAMAEDGVSRIDDSTDKRNKGDFCLWKFSKPGEPVWPSDIGAGRPGWHIEDTAITEKIFGPQYEIHGAGQDLMFPHHEAEIAQQASAANIAGEDFVKYWIHVGFLVNKEQKMSKSLGNFMTLHDALEKHSPEVLRFYFLSAHYTSPLDFSETILKQSEAAVQRIAEFNQKITLYDTGSHLPIADEVKIFDELYEKIIAAMNDDLNIPMALGFVFEAIKKTNELIAQKKDVSQLSMLTAIRDLLENVLGIVPRPTKIESELQKIINRREEARNKKDFDLSDQLREQIKNLGYKIEDTDYGPLLRKIK